MEIFPRFWDRISRNRVSPGMVPSLSIIPKMTKPMGIASVRVVLILLLLANVASRELCAADLVLEILGAGRERIERVGLIHRWDADGNAVKPLDTKQKIESPALDQVAERAASGGTDRWVFRNLKPGRYDLVLLGTDHLRMDGYGYPPVLEFDPFMSAVSATQPALRAWVANDIVRSRHYENIVRPLTVGDAVQGPEDEPKRVYENAKVTSAELESQRKVRLEEGEVDEFDDGTEDSSTRPEAIRTLVMLVRDEATSYEGEMPGAVTIRHEVWQYSYHYGGYQKEKRTRVFDRVILPRDELRRWTWLWDARLGDIVVESEGDSRTIRWTMPDLQKREIPGLYP